MINKPQNVILWIAVSSEEQAKDDKISIPSQLEMGHSRAMSESWQIADTLISDGHSRDYVDIHELAKDARTKGILAFDKLIYYLKNGGFDVLWARDGDRFGRSQTLLAYISESVLKLDAVIYTEHDGYITSQSNRWWSLIKGYQSAHYIDDLREKTMRGKLHLLEHKHLPTNGATLKTHKIIRDTQTGKAIRYALDASVTQEMQDLARIILHGNEHGDYITWLEMENEMFRLYGYGRNGKANVRYHYYYIIHSPTFWGHMGVRLSSYWKGAWIFESGHPEPDGIVIYRDVVPPVYTGKLATQVISALIKRFAKVGRRRHTTFRYSKLCICYECGGTMIRNRKYVRCSNCYSTVIESDCTNRTHCRLDVIDDYVDKMLQALVESDAPIPFNKETLSSRDNIGILQDEIDSLIAKIDKLIDKQLNVSGSLHTRYDDMLKRLGDTLDIKQRQLRDYKSREQQMTSQSRLSNISLNQLREVGVEKFHELSESQKHNMLSALLGNMRIAIDGKEVVGVYPN